MALIRVYTSIVLAVEDVSPRQLIAVPTTINPETILLWAITLLAYP